MHGCTSLSKSSSFLDREIRPKSADTFDVATITSSLTFVGLRRTICFRASRATGFDTHSCKSSVCFHVSEDTRSNVNDLPSSIPTPKTTRLTVSSTGWLMSSDAHSRAMSDRDVNWYPDGYRLFNLPAMQRKDFLAVSGG